MKVLIVGGVAGGAGAAARLRRNDEKAEIILFEKGEYISFANCGLPYYIGGTITERAKLQVQTPQAFRARFNVDVRVQHEVTGVDSAAKTVTVKNHATGETYTESYDSLVLSPGASPIRPKMPGMEENHISQDCRGDRSRVHRFGDGGKSGRPGACSLGGGGRSPRHGSP